MTPFPSFPRRRESRLHSPAGSLDPRLRGDDGEFVRTRGEPALLRLLATLLALLATPAAAQTFPKFTGLVVDAANVLPPAVEADLTAKLQALQEDTKRQLVVATVPDTQGYDLADYGYKLGRAWGVGLKDVDNGAILFVAPGNPAGQRGPRLEVGYGLEPILTDALASQITMQLMTPMLHEGRVPEAMEVGTDAVIAQLRASPEEAQARVDAAVREFDRTNRRSTSGGGGGGGFAIFWLLILGFFILRGLFGGRGRRRRGKGPWGRRRRGGSVWPWIAADILSGIARSSGGGTGGFGGGGGGGGGGWGGGGFSGGGGGSFGGGGASGGW